LQSQQNYTIPTAVAQGETLILLKFFISARPDRYPRSGKVGFYQNFLSTRNLDIPPQFLE